MAAINRLNIRHNEPERTTEETFEGSAEVTTTTALKITHDVLEVSVGRGNLSIKATSPLGEVHDLINTSTTLKSVERYVIGKYKVSANITKTPWDSASGNYGNHGGSISTSTLYTYETFHKPGYNIISGTRKRLHKLHTLHEEYLFQNQFPTDYNLLSQGSIDSNYQSSFNYKLSSRFDESSTQYGRPFSGRLYRIWQGWHQRQELLFVNYHFIRRTYKSGRAYTNGILRHSGDTDAQLNSTTTYEAFSHSEPHPWPVDPDDPESYYNYSTFSLSISTVNAGVPELTWDSQEFGAPREASITPIEYQHSISITVPIGYELSITGSGVLGYSWKSFASLGEYQRQTIWVTATSDSSGDLYYSPTPSNLGDLTHYV